MANTQDIYPYAYKKHEHSLDKLLKSVDLAIEIESLVYQRCYSNGKVISIPMLPHDFLNDYYQLPITENTLFFNFKNLLLMPTINDDHFKSAIYQLHNKSFCFNKINAKHTLNVLPWRLKYHDDQSISWLCIHTKKSDFLVAKSLFYNGHFNRLHKRIDHFILHGDYSFDINDFLFDSLSQPLKLLSKFAPHPEFTQFTQVENLCFWAIYCGKYEAKQIATPLFRSPRTVEGIIGSMTRKLELNNRYELFTKISHSHEHARYLMYPHRR